MNIQMHNWCTCPKYAAVTMPFWQINSSPPSATYIRQWTGSSLVSPPSATYIRQWTGSSLVSPPSATYIRQWTGSSLVSPPSATYIRQWTGSSLVSPPSATYIRQWTGSSLVSPPSATYIRQWTGSSLVQIMASRQVGAKPLPEPMLAYWQLDIGEHISLKFESELSYFHSTNCNSKCRLSKCQFV